MIILACKSITMSLSVSISFPITPAKDKNVMPPDVSMCSHTTIEAQNTDTRGLHAGSFEDSYRLTLLRSCWAMV